MNAVAAPAAVRPARRRKRTQVPDALMLPLAVLAILALWEGAVLVTGVSKVILPRPSVIALALLQGFANPITSRASYFPHIEQTLAELLAGYALGSSIGLALAVLSVRTPVLERLLRPLVVAFQSVPKIALAPLIVVWFGFGFNSKFVLIILATFFPLFVNGITGFKSVEENRINLMRAFGASRWQMFTKVTFPTALPFIFAGLEIALVHAVTSAIVAEFLGGQRGLGVMILQMEQLLDVAGIFSVLIILAVIGWLLNAMLGVARRRVVFWAPEASANVTS